MDILFINSHTGSGTLPLASACLAAVLEDRFGSEVNCPVLELTPDFDIENSVREILSIKPDMIAMTLYSWSKDRLLNLSESLIAAFDSDRPQILAGGPEVTADPVSIQRHSAVDLAVSGEGENAIAAIVDKLCSLPAESRPAALAEFPAPYIVPPVTELDSLPSPWKARYISGRDYRDTVWELTRGCPFGCHFCFESKGSGLLRHKSIQRIKSELTELQDRNTGNVFILDPTFNASPRRANEILRLFISQAPELQYHMEVRTEFLDEEQAALYAELGAVLQIGLQTADPEVAAGIGRPFAPERFREKLWPLHEYGVTYGLDLIYGLPGDSLEGFRESLDFALSCAPNHLDIFPLSVLPGTRLRETASGLGLRHLDEAPYTVTGRDGFSNADLSDAAELAATVDRLYNSGRAVPWFLTAAGELGLRPVEIIDTYRKEGGNNRQKGNATEPGEFISKLAEKSGRQSIGPILSDLVRLFTIESAGREQLPSDELPVFTYDPQILLQHIEMGISELDELMAFVPENPGVYQAVTDSNGLSFVPVGKAEF